MTKISEYSTLVGELCLHVKDLASEAEQGSPDAQAWLLAGFPGHREHLARFWGNLTVEQRIDAMRRRGAALTGELSSLQHDLSLAVGAQRAQRSHHLWEQMTARNTALDQQIAEREAAKRAEQQAKEAEAKEAERQFAETRADVARRARDYVYGR